MRRMNAAVGNQLGQRGFGYFAAHRIEAADDDYAGSVVDDNVDAVAFSKARMLRPSRPMMRPFISSLGISTVLVVVSAVCVAA